MTGRALLLENVHDDAAFLLRDAGYDVDRRTAALGEDELVEAVRQGRYTAEQATRFEADADAVEQIVAAWGSPFCDGWETFRPDPGWPVPGLPEGWPAGTGLLSPVSRAAR